MKSLHDSVALVTGASRGIGRAIAETLASAGCRVALSARSEASLSETVERCREKGGDALPIGVDLATDSGPSKVVETTVARLGRLDILVNNAGVMTRNSVQESDPDDWDAMINLNLRALMRVTRLAVPHLAKRPRSAIINVASIAGKMTSASGAGYAASKHGVVGFSGALFEDVRELGIKVCTLCPGFVRTDMVVGDGLDGERMIQPSDVAETVLFVATFPDTGCPTEIILRPQRSPYVA